MKPEERNFFDDLDGLTDPEELKRIQQDQKAAGQKLDYLIHKVFEQSDEGKELLNIWQDALIMRPTVMGGMDQFQAGINEGQKSFIRGIVLTIRKVEKGEK